MKRNLLVLLVILTAVFGLAMQAAAIDVVYTGSGNYSITALDDAHATVTEDYNAKSLIPSTALGFTSHDGFAVVDFATGAAHTAANAILFAKTVTLDELKDLSKNFEMTFNILNTSPFIWSDYHIALSNPLGTGAVLPTITFTQSADFKTTSFTNFTADWAVSDPIDGSKFINPTPDQFDVLHLNFTLDTSNCPLGEIFTLTQIATGSPVPIPPSALLLGSGLLGLVGFGWRRKRG